MTMTQRDQEYQHQRVPEQAERYPMETARAFSLGVILARPSMQETVMTPSTVEVETTRSTVRVRPTYHFMVRPGMI
jgi:hypothetical protein